ncbi:alpha/beta hydrolase [Streptomyces sp. B6B3]|uniref:alpha/beta hydrolase family protein n=1 Tax=Streptomyces sp. B6B3 TaxID=3153570 RepID=UPI00325CD949
MPMQRRTFLSLGAATGVGLSLVGAGQALGRSPAARTVTPLDAPAEPFAVGVREYAWTRGDRRCTTFVYYPATGEPGGDPVTDAPVAEGAFPVCNFTHGYGASPQGSEFVIRPLAEAGFVVPAPHFQFDFGQIYSGEYSRDVSEIITRTLALNEADDPLAGHIDAAPGVGVSGHSMGGMTTHGLLTAWPDDRITAAIPQSTVDMGDPASEVTAKVLFVHGDQDPTCPYDQGRQAYEELSAPKAFLTFLGGDHVSFWSDDRFPVTCVDWMRWSLYGDTAARDRLPEDASGDDTSWEFIQE